MLLIADVRQAIRTQHLDKLMIHLSAKFHMHSSNSLSTFATKPAAKQTIRTAAILILEIPTTIPSVVYSKIDGR